MRPTHEVMHRTIIASAVSESEWNSVLIRKNEAVLLSLDVLSANTWRKIVRVDSAFSVMGLIPAIGFFCISDSLGSSCQPSS